MRIKNLILGFVSLALIGTGVALAAFFFFFLGQSSENTATNSADPGGFNVPEIDAAHKEEQEAVAGGPEDKTLTVTIPKIARVTEAVVPDADGDDEEALKNYAAIHLKGSGFPWQKEANVYLAGHRLGYPGYPSFLAFYGLDDLENGDKVFVTDTDGNEYTYRVFKKVVVNPTDLWVTEPVAGKNILTLQTCTLPDYAQRLVVQAELVEKA